MAVRDDRGPASAMAFSLVSGVPGLFAQRPFAQPHPWVRAERYPPLVIFSRPDRSGFSKLVESRGYSHPMVQLGGLEPPTSCSTDRRSNQLSYNCIRHGAQPLKKGAPNGAETRCNAPLWQGRRCARSHRFAPIFQTKAHLQSKSPGNRPGPYSTQ